MPQTPTQAYRGKELYTNWQRFFWPQLSEGTEPDNGESCKTIDDATENCLEDETEVVDDTANCLEDDTEVVDDTGNSLEDDTEADDDTEKHSGGDTKKCADSLSCKSSICRKTEKSVTFGGVTQIPYLRSHEQLAEDGEPRTVYSSGDDGGVKLKAHLLTTGSQTVTADPTIRGSVSRTQTLMNSSTQTNLEIADPNPSTEEAEEGGKP